jgi:phenylpyruvate tautomerase PptA (4-oxalocrotonate tautomerase family)
MPMLDVRIVGEPSGPPARGQSLARHLADMVADIIHVPANSVWITVETVPVDHYAENGELAPEQLPVFVKISKLKVDGAEALAPEAAALTRAFAAALGRPEAAIRIFYQVIDRVSLGGKMH